MLQPEGKSYSQGRNFIRSGETLYPRGKFYTHRDNLYIHGGNPVPREGFATLQAASSVVMPAEQEG